MYRSFNVTAGLIELLVFKAAEYDSSGHRRADRRSAPFPSRPYAVCFLSPVPLGVWLDPADLPHQIEVGFANGKTGRKCKEAEITVQTEYRWRKEYGAEVPARTF